MGKYKVTEGLSGRRITEIEFSDPEQALIDGDEYDEEEHFAKLLEANGEYQGWQEIPGVKIMKVVENDSYAANTDICNEKHRRIFSRD